jgi:hypothetical protein
MVAGARRAGKDDGTSGGIQFVWRHDDAGAGPVNSAVERRISTNEVTSRRLITTASPLSSKVVGVGGSSGASWPRWFIARTFAAHPARGWDAADTSRPGSARSSTSSGSPASSRRTFGTRMPRELPMPSPKASRSSNPFVAAGKILPFDSFVQAQAGVELPSTAALPPTKVSGASPTGGRPGSTGLRRDGPQPVGPQVSDRLSVAPRRYRHRPRTAW